MLREVGEGDLDHSLWGYLGLAERGRGTGDWLVVRPTRESNLVLTSSSLSEDEEDEELDSEGEDGGMVMAGFRAGVGAVNATFRTAGCGVSSPDDDEGDEDDDDRDTRLRFLLRTRLGGMTN